MHRELVDAIALLVWWVGGTVTDIVLTVDSVCFHMGGVGM